MTSSNVSGKSWKIIVAILGIIFIGFFLAFTNWGGFMSFITGESESTLYLEKVNQSFVPQKNIISLTNEDFKVFPKLAPVIRDETQKPIGTLANGEILYRIPLTGDERHTFHEHYMPYYTGEITNDRFLEYKGKYYRYDPPVLH
jgi:hypothetical protein